jgi:Protein of unknown function (DUF2911)
MSRVSSTAFLCILLAQGALSAAEPSRAKAELTLNGVTMTIDYGRPSLRGRDMLSQAPKGFVWRLGADEATLLTLTDRAVFGTMVLQKGSYTLFVERTAEDRWTLLVNSETGQWGTEHDRAKDLMGVPLKWEKGAPATEVLTIDLTPEDPQGGTGILSIRWGEHVLKQRFSLSPSK